MANEFDWSKLKPANITTPKEILYKFADSFNASVGMDMIMEIKTLQRDSINFDDIFSLGMSSESDKSKLLVYKVVVTIPALDNYVQHVLTVSHSMINIYPCTIEIPMAISENDKEKKCIDSDELRASLQDVAKMDEVISSLANLLALAR